MKPRPEVSHVGQNLRCVGFREETVVGRDEDGGRGKAEVEEPGRSLGVRLCLCCVILYGG